MKAYEYMVCVTEEIFSVLVATGICVENYYSNQKKEPSNIGRISFQGLFESFNRYREKYDTMFAENDDILSEKVVDSRLMMDLRVKREEILKKYIEWLEKEIVNDKKINDIDYKQKVTQYYQELDSKNVSTIDMDVLLYPHLLIVKRENEE